MHDDYAIRVATRQEVDLAAAWAANEGWNPGLGDADCFHATDASGFLIGLLRGEPVAVISAVKYGSGFGFVGFYIVAPPHRGRGYGWRLWQAAMASLSGRNVGLDGVIAQQSNYVKSGFALAYRNVRHQGVADGAPHDGRGLVALSTLPFDEVRRYDAPFFPDDRTAFLRAWLAQSGHVGVACREGDRVTGYGVVRPCHTGWKIGPLFADTPDIAERLFMALAANVPAGGEVFLDIPEVNADALDLVRRHGMHPVFETARMYTGAQPDLPTGRLFGVTSFELG